jgi:hypothetical protein
MSSNEHLKFPPSNDTLKLRSPEDRLNEIAGVMEKRFRSRLRSEIVPEVTEAYPKSPLGPHDDRTARVARAFGRLPLAGKEVVVPVKPGGPYAIARFAVGEPGGLIEGSDQYDNYYDAFRAIFKSRSEKMK